MYGRTRHDGCSGTHSAWLGLEPGLWSQYCELIRNHALRGYFCPLWIISFIEDVEHVFSSWVETVRSHISRHEHCVIAWIMSDSLGMCLIELTLAFSHSNRYNKTINYHSLQLSRIAQVLLGSVLLVTAHSCNLGVEWLILRPYVGEVTSVVFWYTAGLVPPVQILLGIIVCCCLETPWIPRHRVSGWCLERPGIQG